MGESDGSNFVMTGSSSRSNGRLFRACETLSLTDYKALSISSSALNSADTMDMPSRLRDETLFKPPMVLICSSSGFDIRRSISSGVAPEYAVETVTTPNDMSGISSVFSFENDIIPNTMTINMIDRTKTGRFTDKEGMLIFTP
jgi:hypothetical protein